MNPPTSIKPHLNLRATGNPVTLNCELWLSGLLFSRNQICAVLALLLIFVFFAETKSQRPNSSSSPGQTAVATSSETAPQPAQTEKAGNAVSAQMSANRATAVNRPGFGAGGGSLLKRFVMLPIRIVKAIVGSFGEGSKSDTNHARGGVEKVIVTAEAKLPGDSPSAQVLSDTAANLSAPNPSASNVPQLVEFVWRSKSNRELGKILVPPGYIESTKTYTEGVQTKLGYPDGSYIILHKGGMITLPFLKAPEYEVIKSGKSTSRLVREGRVRGTELFWREENSYGVWPPLNLAFANVPKAEVNLFENAIASFKPPQDQGVLVFVGSVIKIGPSPRMRCGVVAPYRLAKYRVERVIEGNYDQHEIVVDHLFCRGDELNDLKKGDVVVVKVSVTPYHLQLEQSYDGEIRKEGDEVRTFYIAREITPVPAISAKPSKLKQDLSKVTSSPHP
jgi:hypothetical protein